MCLLAVVMAGLSLSASCESEESDKLSYVITNSTSYSITGVYVSTSGFMKWGANFLRSSTIASGRSHTLSLSPNYYYFRLTTSAGCDEWGLPVLKGDGISEQYTSFDWFYEACD